MDSSFRHQATGSVVRREVHLGRKEIVALIDKGAEVSTVHQACFPSMPGLELWRQISSPSPIAATLS